MITYLPFDTLLNIKLNTREPLVYQTDGFQWWQFYQNQSKLQLRTPAPYMVAEQLYIYMIRYIDEMKYNDDKWSNINILYSQ